MSERVRERGVPVLPPSPDLPGRLQELRPTPRSRGVRTFAERSCGARGAAGPPARSRPMAAPGGGTGRLPWARPGVAFSGPGTV